MKEDSTKPGRIARSAGLGELCRIDAVFLAESIDEGLDGKT